MMCDKRRAGPARTVDIEKATMAGSGFEDEQTSRDAKKLLFVYKEHFAYGIGATISGS